MERPIRRGSIGYPALTPRRLGLIVPVAMAAMVIIIVTSTSRATSCMAEPEPTATDVELLGSTTTEAPVIAVVGDCVPEELMPAIQREAGARGRSVLPLTFGGCSVTGTLQVDDEGQRFNWSSRCSEGYSSMQSGAIQEFDPDMVLWYSSRERFSVLAGGVVKQPGSPEHRDQLEANLEAAYERLAAGGSAGAHRAAESLVDRRHRQVRRRSVGAP